MRTPLWLGEGNTGKPRVQPGFWRVPTELSALPTPSGCYYERTPGCQAYKASFRFAGRRDYMRIRRRLPLILAVVLVIAAVALAVVLRKHAPPEAARLLPGADGFVYVNLGWMRRANLTGELPPVPHDPDYEQFIQATGFQFERDLDEVALAIHYSAGPSGPKTGNFQPRYSEVFVGKFDGERLRAYLRQISSSVDNYQTREIYNIPLEGRTLRVSILGVDTVAASNLDDSLVIRGIIQRSRKLASPFGGPALLRQYYKDVPLASLGWAIFKIQPSAGFAVSGPVIGWSFLLRSRRPLWPQCAISAQYILKRRHLLEATRKPARWRHASIHTSTFFVRRRAQSPRPAQTPTSKHFSIV